MQKSPSNKARRRPRAIREKKYDISEYINNEPMIKGLFFEHLELIDKLKSIEELDRIKSKEMEIKVKEIVLLELKLKLVEQKIKHLESQSIPDTIITVAVALLFGFGVKLASIHSPFD